MPDLPTRISLQADLIVEPCTPFGERWIPRVGPLDIDQIIKDNLKAVVDQVRRAKFVIIENTRPPEVWSDLHPHMMSSIPQTFIYPYAESAPVIMMHGNEGSPDISLANKQDLYTSAKLHLAKLKKRLVPFPSEFLERFRISQMIEAYEQDQEAYYEHRPLGPLNMVQNELDRRIAQYRGSLWVRGQTWPEIMQEGTMLQYLEIALREFKFAIGRDAEKHTHRWAKNPGTTLLFAQDSNDRFSAPENIVYSFAEGVENNRHSSLKKDFILRSDTRRGSRYTTHSQVLQERQNRW